MANRILVFDKLAFDPAANQYFQLIFVDNGANFNLFVKDVSAFESPGLASLITSAGATPVVPPGGAGVTGTGTTNTVPLWTNGPGGVIGNSVITQAAALVGVGLGAVAPPTILTAGDSSAAATRGVMSWQASNDTGSAHLHLRKSRGTFAVPLIVVTGDLLGRVVYSGFDGATYLESSSVRVTVTGTVALTRIPTKMEFLTATDAAPSVPTVALTLNKDQSAQFANTIQLGTVSVATGGLLLANSASAFLTTIQAGNAAAARTYTWPTNFGAAGTVLTDAGGNGTLSWAPSGGNITINTTTIAGGATTRLLYDNAGTVGEAAGVTTDGNVLTLAPAPRTSGSAPYHLITAPADTTLTASVEAIGVSFVGAIRQHATGALALQREYVFAAPTYSFVAASTLTQAATVSIPAAPIQGTSATITDSYCLLVGPTPNTGSPITEVMIVASSSTRRCLALEGSRAAGNADPIFAVLDFTAGAVDFQITSDGAVKSSSFASIFGTTNGLVVAQDCIIGFSATNQLLGTLVGVPVLNIKNSGSGASRMFVLSNDTSTIGAMLQNTGGRQRVTADIPVVTSTAFVNITGLGFNAGAAGKYTGRLVVKCNNTTAAEGIKFDFNGGTATITSFWAAASAQVGGTTVLGTVVSTSLAGVINFTTITGETLIVIEFSVVIANAGTVIPRFAENSAAAGTVTVELGSFMWTESMPL